METSITNPAEVPQTPVFPQTLHRLRPDAGRATAKSKKRGNGKSRDTHEDRGMREIKTSHNA